MVPPSAPRTNWILFEMVPERCLILALEQLLARRPEGILVEPRSIPRGKFLNASARRSNCFPFRPNSVAIRSQGTQASAKALETRDRRSPLTTRRMSRIAKGSCCRARYSQKLALAQIAKSGGLQFRSELPAVLANGRAAGGVGANAGAFLSERGFVMRNGIDIDPKHSRAIVQEIGERLHAFLKEEPELPESLRTQIDRLRELEEPSPSIIPAAERWDKRRR
jgi:hypothetical protein